MGSTTTKRGVKTAKITPLECFSNPKISRVLYLLELFPKGLSRPDIESLLNTADKDKGVKEALEALQYFGLISSKHERNHQVVRGKYEYNIKTNKEEISIEKGLSAGRPAAVYRIKKDPFTYLFTEVLPTKTKINKGELLNLKMDVERYHIQEKFLSTLYSELGNIKDWWHKLRPSRQFKTIAELSRFNAVLTKEKEARLKETMELLSEKEINYLVMVSGYVQVRLLDEYIQLMTKGQGPFDSSYYLNLGTLIEFLDGRSNFLVKKMLAVIRKPVFEEEELESREQYDIKGRREIKSRVTKSKVI